MVEAAASAAASAIAVEAYKDGRGMLGYISKKIEYADDLKVNFDTMTEQAGTLHARRVDVEAEIKKNEEMMEATNVCKDWICRVEKAKQEVLKLKSKYEKETGHAWRVPRLWQRANLSERMARKREELKGLLIEGTLPNGVVAERPLERVIIIEAPSTENVPALHWAVEQILGNLEVRNVKWIGLWGMVGTGKTTVMQNVNNNEVVNETFDIVIWVSVSKGGSIEKVQDAIMQRLKLKVEGGVSTTETAQLISKKLRGMRYLLLFDEVWDPFDLHQIGIPNNDKDSKVVFASRCRDFCRIHADELVNMKPLSDGDAYKIFEEVVGRSMENPRIRPIALQVIRECGGLLLLINKVAKVFRTRGDDIGAWSDELRSLQRCSSTISQGMDEVLECLRFFYNELKEEDRKVCFLDAAEFFPEDDDICVDHLIERWMSEGFLQSNDEFRDARNRGRKILQDLMSVSLLEDSPRKGHVRMHKVVRNMALKIASEGPDYKLLARTREGLKECPREEGWAQTISFSPLHLLAFVCISLLLVLLFGVIETMY